MTQEEKQLLLKTICAMLPYGIQAQVPRHVNPLQILCITKLHKGTWAWKRGKYIVSFWNDTCSIETIKPYIRPMSSMTEEKKAYIYAQRIDWLLSGDDGEKSFHKRLKEELQQLKDGEYE